MESITQPADINANCKFSRNDNVISNEAMMDNNGNARFLQVPFHKIMVGHFRLYLFFLLHCTFQSKINQY